MEQLLTSPIPLSQQHLLNHAKTSPSSLIPHCCHNLAKWTGYSVAWTTSCPPPSWQSTRLIKKKPSADAESWFTQYLFSGPLHFFMETKTFILPESLPTPVVPVCEQASIKLIHEKSTHVAWEVEVICKRGLPARVTAETSAPGASRKRECIYFCLEFQCWAGNGGGIFARLMSWLLWMAQQYLITHFSHKF